MVLHCMSEEATKLMVSSPALCAYIGRWVGKFRILGSDGYYGNPIERGEKCSECGETHFEHGSTLPCFEQWARVRIETDNEYRQRVRALYGKHLLCHCHASQHCHGSVLETLARELNGPDADSGPQEKNDMKTSIGRIIAVTGHRPTAYAPYPECYSRSFQAKLEDFAAEVLVRMNAVETISMLNIGMAQGWDQAVAVAAIELEIPWTAYVPCRNQERKWHNDGPEIYREILAQAPNVELNDVPYYDGCMTDRNKDMVNNANELLALYNGAKYGGTAHCFGYAKERGLKLWNVWKYWTGEKAFPEVK